MPQKSLRHLLPKGSVFGMWLESWPLAEPPESYILFSAMSAMGAVLGRRIWHDADVGDSLRLWPMLNLLLVGPSGIGKSTSIVRMVEPFLLRRLPKEEQPSFLGPSTREKIHADLMVHSQAILFADEFAAFFNRAKYNENLVPYITNLLDYKPELSLGTRKDGEMVVIAPSVTVMGGTTATWLRDQLPDSVVGGGFLPRYFIVPEEHKQRRVANARFALTYQQRIDLEEKRDEAVREFYNCIHCHEGHIDYSDFEALDAYSTWFTSYLPATGYLAPFAQRAGEFVLRIAMLLAISCNRRSISAEDIRASIALYEYAHGKLQDVVVPVREAGRIAATLLETMGDGEWTEQELCRAMRNMCSSQETQKFLTSLRISGEVRLVGSKYSRRKV